MSLWKWLTWPDPAKTALPVRREAIVTGTLGRVALDPSWGFEYKHLVSMFGDGEYSGLTERGARVFEDWARERYFKRPKWTKTTDCEKQRAFGMAERLLAWQELYPEKPLCAVGKIVFKRKGAGWHDTSFYYVRDESNTYWRPIIIEDETGKFVETKETVELCGYFGGP